MLVCVASYDNSFCSLPGVKLDEKNLRDFCDKHNIIFNSLSKNNLFEDSLDGSVRNIKPNIIWLSGHGIVDSSKQQVAFVLPKITSFPFFTDSTLMHSEEFGNILEKRLSKDNVLVVVDICHSATLLNLKYYFKNGIFYEKIDDKLFEPNFKNKVVVCIAAASDHTVTYESSTGGFLTNSLIDFFDENQDISLSMIDNLSAMNPGSEMIISVSKPFSPYKNFLSFSKEKTERSVHFFEDVASDDPAYIVKNIKELKNGAYNIKIF